jgi:hypothetical protein
MASSLWNGFVLIEPPGSRGLWICSIAMYCASVQFSTGRNGRGFNRFGAALHRFAPVAPPELSLLETRTLVARISARTNILVSGAGRDPVQEPP